jgi:hypothetical protein
MRRHAASIFALRAPTRKSRRGRGFPTHTYEVKASSPQQASFEALGKVGRVTSVRACANA